MPLCPGAYHIKCNIDNKYWVTRDTELKHSGGGTVIDSRYLNTTLEFNDTDKSGTSLSRTEPFGGNRISLPSSIFNNNYQVSVELFAASFDEEGRSGPPISKVYLSNDKSNWTSYNLDNKDGKPFSNPWTLSEGDGTKTVFARFENSDGVVFSSISASTVFTLDTTPPVIILPKSGKGGRSSERWATFEVEVSDMTSGIQEKTASLVLSTKNYKGTFTSLGGNKYQIKFTSIVIANKYEYSLNVTAIDNAGNSNTVTQKYLAYFNNNNKKWYFKSSSK